MQFYMETSPLMGDCNYIQYHIGQISTGWYNSNLRQKDYLGLCVREGNETAYIILPRQFSVLNYMLTGFQFYDCTILLTVSDVKSLLDLYQNVLKNLSPHEEYYLMSLKEHGIMKPFKYFGVRQLVSEVIKILTDKLATPIEMNIASEPAHTMTNAGLIPTHIAHHFVSLPPPFWKINPIIKYMLPHPVHQTCDDFPCDISVGYCDRLRCDYEKTMNTIDNIISARNQNVCVDMKNMTLNDLKMNVWRILCHRMFEHFKMCGEALYFLNRASHGSIYHICCDDDSSDDYDDDNHDDNYDYYEDYCDYEDDGNDADAGNDADDGNDYDGGYMSLSSSYDDDIDIP
jgi:hypothetical protein